MEPRITMDSVRHAPRRPASAQRAGWARCVATASVLAAGVLLPCVPRPVEAAPGLIAVTPAEATFFKPSISITGTELPRRLTVTLVETGVASPKRIRTRVRRLNAGEVKAVSRAALVPDRVYDVEVQPRGGALLVLPASFTARGVRFTELVTRTTYAQEEVVATLDFATSRTRLAVDGVRAANLDAGRTDPRTFRFIMPDVPFDAAGVSVTATDRGVSAVSATKLQFADGRRQFAARIGRAPFVTRRQSYDDQGATLVLTGGSSVAAGNRTFGSFLTVRLPVNLSTANFPVTFTEASSASVEWFSTTDGRPGIPGPRGRYAGGTFSVTIDGVDGTLVHGSLFARLEDLTGGVRRKDLELTVSRFEVDPAE